MTLLLELALGVPLFFGVVLGLAWPLASRLALDPAEKLCAAVMLALVGAYLFAFALYEFRAPVTLAWILPVLAGGALIGGRRTFVATLRDRDARAMLGGLLLVTGWCVGGLSLVASYSGGGWAGDWFEHWERTRFFTEHWPIDHAFLGFAALPARPPLANLVAGLPVAALGTGFAGYQLIMTLLNCLAFLPAALLARRFLPPRDPMGKSSRGAEAIAVLTVLLMLNPSFVQNATFAWTKLIAAFFVLVGLYFFLRAHDSPAPRAAGPLAAMSLAAGILVHYSAAPYALLLAAAWLGLNRARWRRADYWRQTGLLIAVGGLLLTSWFAWSFATYGWNVTLFSNSSVAVPEARHGNQLLKVALNLRDTLVPHFLRTVDPALIAQRSAFGYERDWFFQLYQVNLLFVFGSLAWLVLAVRLARAMRTASARCRAFWIWLVGGAIGLGVAVHGARDEWGLAHICLQALVPLGLAYLAARWSELGRCWRLVVAAGAAVDFVFGLALQFAAESQTPDLPLMLGRMPPGTLPRYNFAAEMNLGAKLTHGLSFFRDAAGVPMAVTLMLLAGILLLAFKRARAISPE